MDLKFIMCICDNLLLWASSYSHANFQVSQYTPCDILSELVRMHLPQEDQVA